MPSTDLDMHSLRALRSQFSQALKDFAASSSSFKVLHTIPPTSAPTPNTPILTRTLYVLDSSFNPPSKAHSSLVKAALKSRVSSSEHESSPRVLFLLATVNADKKPKPADFEDRIVMMTLAAEDLRSSFQSQSASSTGLKDTDVHLPTIDIGITKLPYFVDKASSIESCGVYTSPQRSETAVTEQIHLTGFDTLIRIFTPKYYPNHHPPLSALEPFLTHHCVRATIRVDPDSPSENLKDAQKTASESSESGFSSAAGQRRYLEDIKNGSLEKKGMKKAWAEKLELVVDESGEAVGVSSTRVRNAVKAGNWDEVSELVGPSVGAWIEETGLYLEDTDGGKL